MTTKGNFRDSIGTLATYKGNRQGTTKSYHWQTVGDRLKDRWGAIELSGIEADDMLSIRMSECPLGAYVIATVDKDLLSVPGLHYTWQVGDRPEVPIHQVDPVGHLTIAQNSDGSYKVRGDGLIFFYAQMLMGDPVDNIKGVPKVGPKMAFEALNGLTTEGSMYEVVYQKYLSYFGDKAQEAMNENGNLLWMIRDRGWLEDLGFDPETRIQSYKVLKMWGTKGVTNEEDTGAVLPPKGPTVKGDTV